MIFGRAAIYFEEVARRGSVRRASEHLNIAPSAVDRQIIQLEQSLGIPLFERTPKGLKPTAAGELLVEAIRRWQRDFARAKSQIDDLIGLKRGEVTIALVEGASELLKRYLVAFHATYPSIVYRLHVTSAKGVVDLLLSGESDIGLSFNPPESHEIRVERTLLFGLGLVVSPEHALAGRDKISLAEAAAFPLIIPDESISLRAVIGKAWARSVGGPIRYFMECNSFSMVKSYARSGIGVGILTEIDAMGETADDSLRFIEISDRPAPFSALALVSANSRTLSVPASLLLRHISSLMAAENVPSI